MKNYKLVILLVVISALSFFFGAELVHWYHPGYVCYSTSEV